MRAIRLMRFGREKKKHRLITGKIQNRKAYPELSNKLRCKKSPEKFGGFFV